MFGMGTGGTPLAKVTQNLPVPSVYAGTETHSEL